MPLWRLAREDWRPMRVLNGHPMPQILVRESR
jgi:hypothetical protein